MVFVWMFFCVGAGFTAGWAVAVRQHREAEEVRARFLSFVAHELNTPVTSMYMTVMNFVSGLFGPIPEEHKPWVSLMREQTTRLSCLVGDLRDLLHVEFHRDLQPSLEKVPVDELLGQCLDSMKDSMARAGAVVDLRVDLDLPPVAADPDRLGRSLSAILTHARKFRTGGPILVKAERGRESVRVIVEFSGVKLPHEDLPRVLDIYFPVQSPESQVLAGVGLGLGLSRRLVEAQGGRMSLDMDEEGRYAVSIEIPRYEER